MSNGSKELLLALSWLIGEKNIIEVLLWDEIKNSKINQEFYSFSNKSSKELELEVESNTLENYKKSTLLLTGKINSHIKTAVECNRKLAELINKVQKFHSIIQIYIYK